MQRLQRSFFPCCLAILDTALVPVTSDPQNVFAQLKQVFSPTADTPGVRFYILYTHITISTSRPSVSPVPPVL